MMLVIGMILAALFFFAVWRWWAEGIYETSDALLLFAVIGGLIFGLFAARTIWGRLLAFVPLAAAGGYLIYSYKTGGMRAYMRNQCKEYMHAIEFDPRNLAAREYLATTLYNLGDLDGAIDELQVAVNMGAPMDANYKLNQWLKEQRLRDTDNPVCKWCGTENKPGAATCCKCGNHLPYDNSFSRWLMGGKTALARKLLLAVAGIGLASISFLLLPPKLAWAPVLMGIVALIGWSMISSARN